MKSVDVVVVASFLISGCWIGSSYVAAARTTNNLPAEPRFNQRVFGAALMSVCGRGTTTPFVPMVVEAGTPPNQRPLIDFLAMRRETLACGDIPADIPVDGLDGMQRASRYLLLMATGAWRVSGPTWVGIDRLLGLLYGLSIGLTYLICRLAMGRVVAAGVAALFMISPLHLTNLPDLRDYSKAPFFLASLLVIGLLVTRRRPAPVVVGLAAGAGAMLGFGFGVRTDVVLNILGVLAAVTLFLPERLADSWRPRVIGAAACIAAFAVVALPILRSQASGSNLWHWGLLGYAYGYDDALDIVSAPYEPGYFYDDSYVATVVDAYWGRVAGNPTKVSVGLPQYEPASRAYYSLILTTFPADALLRAWAAVIKTLDLPFSGAPPLSSGLLPDWLARAISIVGRARARLAGLGVWLFAGVVLVMSTRSARLASLIFGLAAFLGAYPAIQFQQRHIFHLELLSLWMLGLVTSSAFTVIRHARTGVAAWPPPGGLIRPAVRAMSFGVVVVALVLLPLVTVRAYQQRTAAALLANYDTAVRAPIAIRPESLGNGLVRVARGVDAFARRPVVRSVFSEMLVVDVTGERCVADQLTLSFRYATPYPDHDFSRTLTVPVPAEGLVTTVFFPVYETGSGSPDSTLLVFDGMEIAESELPCLKRLSRFASPDSFPLLLTTVLPPDWRTLPLHQTLSGWERRVQPGGERAVTYWAPQSLRERRWSLLARSAGTDPGVGVDVDFTARIARLAPNGTVAVSGVAMGRSAYLVAWKEKALGAATVVVAEGTIERGGVTIGLTEKSAWAARVDVARLGAFRAVVQAPHAGEYQLVVASNLSDSSLRNQLTISRIAFVDGIRE